MEMYQNPLQVVSSSSPMRHLAFRLHPSTRLYSLGICHLLVLAPILNSVSFRIMFQHVVLIWAVLGYNDWLTGQSQFQDMHTLHPSYMFNAPEVTNEYNLLGDFLSNSLLDDGGMFQGDDLQGIYSDPTLMNSMTTLGGPNPLLQQTQPPAPTQNQTAPGDSLQRPSSTVPNDNKTDKARETYYMTAADPSGSDPPEERMNKLLKAKYDAGLLKPFNYVKGYARLNQYMEKHMKQASRHKILRQLDKFRPKFRERMQSLTDIELILVEMWFERSLMEYDRVFASMAIPACCWRRTGEIFRGNKEMAELIGVPIEALRDVSHQLLPKYFGSDGVTRAN